MKGKNEASPIKRVDCAIIAMLEEEKKLFLKYSERLIETVGSVRGNVSFTEFVFFDKDGHQRDGVICSGTSGMGNTAACALFYALSRNYIADLYINIGVAGYVKEVRIGDVVVLNRITTMGENNANNATWQLQDAPVYPGVAAVVSDLEKEYGEEFKAHSKDRIAVFRSNLEQHMCSEEKIDSILGDANYSKMQSGFCLTVPEVIKTGMPGDNVTIKTQQDSRFPDIRKYNLLDMEAYYFSVWHDLIKMWEPDHSVTSSIFLSFKSISDMADENKELVEKCGSRFLAMENLSEVVGAFLTEVHFFPRTTESTLYSYFQSEICTLSLDPLMAQAQTEAASKCFGELAHYFIVDSTDSAILGQESVTGACDILSAPSNSLWLSGRAGTGKSTFISYVFWTIIARKKRAVLIDFSKLNEKTKPTDNQTIYLLKRLLLLDHDLIVLLDGINTYYANYERLLEVMQLVSCSNVSLCVSDVSNNGENYEHSLERNPKDFLSGNARIVKCSFAGISLFNPHFDQLIESARKYFCTIKKSFGKDGIRTLVEKSQLQYLDFRLLKMLAECELNNTRNLFDLVDRYCVSKTKRAVLVELYSHNPFTLAQDETVSVEGKKAYLTLSKNAYARAFLFANCCVQIICNRTKSLEDFLNSDYILSDDMNLFLSHLVNRRRIADGFCRNALDLLSGNYSMSCSAETQIMYNLFQIETLNRVQTSKRKETICKKVEHALQQYTENKSKDDIYLDWLLQYRTFSILLAQYCSEPTHLRSYIRLLLSDSDAERNNLAFHLCYYSRQEFTFKLVHTLEIEYVSAEMFYNTYFILFDSLNLDNSQQDVAGKLVTQDSFIYMNLITFAHLVKTFLIENSSFPDLSHSAKTLLEKVDQAMKASERANPKADFPLAEIQHLVSDVCNGLDLLQEI